MCVCVVPGADNSDKGLINIHLQIHPSSSGAYTAQRRVRSSQRLKETHKNEGEEEAKSSRGYLNPHKCSINNSSSAGTSTQMLQIRQHIHLESSTKRTRKKQELQEIQYGPNIEEWTFQMEGKIGQVSVLLRMVRFLVWMPSLKPEWKIRRSVTEEGRQKECGDKARL